MFVKFNPNPDGLNVGDCTVRAICAATGESWESVHKHLCDLSRAMCDMPSADRVWWQFLRQNGFSRRRVIDQCPDCYTVADFARDHPRGMYILCPQGHVVCVINGDWLDTWDSGETVPIYYFMR